jgi:steroid delta-isomerase-like uncharacterized protein
MSAHKALAQRWFEEVWNKGRVEAIDEMLAADALVHGLGDTMGKAGFKTFHAAYRDAFPDVAIRVDRAVVEGDTVAVHWSGSGTHKGAGLGFAATGQPVKFSGMTFLRVQNGRLVEGWNNFDQLGMLQQVGAVTLGPASAAATPAKTRAKKKAAKKTATKRSVAKGRTRKGQRRKARR